MNKIKNNLYLLISLLLFGLYLYLNRRFVLVDVSLSSDEIYSWNLSRMPWFELFSNIIHNTIQFSYYIILKIWTYFIPVNNDFWIRIPSLTFGILGISIVLSFIHKKIGSTPAAFIASYILIDSIFLELITMNRSYSLVFLLSSLNITSLYLYNCDLHKKVSQKIFIISLTLLLFVHNLSIFYITSLTATLYFVKIKILKDIKKPTFYFLITAVIIFTTIFIYQYMYNLDKISWINEDRKSFTRAWPVLLLYISSLFVLRKKLFIEKEKFITIVSVIPLLGVMALTICHFLVTPILVDRYLFIFYPHLYILLAFATREAVKSSKEILYISVFLLIHYSFNSHDLVMKDYSHRSDVKHFMKNIKDKKILNIESEPLCLINNNYIDILDSYSQMYLNYDICKMKKFYNLHEKYNKTKYIIYHDKKGVSEDFEITGYRTLYKFNTDFIILKKY